MRRVLKCVFTYDKSDHLETLCGWQEVKIQLLTFISCSHLEMFLNIVFNPGIEQLDGMVISSSIC